jgi:hypothetical protein
MEGVCSPITYSKMIVPRYGHVLINLRAQIMAGYVDIDQIIE